MKFVCNVKSAMLVSFCFQQWWFCVCVDFLKLSALKNCAAGYITPKCFLLVNISFSLLVLFRSMNV